ncbi:MAG: flagellar basal body L-ring protein FlgH [Candidatus Latescibacterota bacterium]|nr:flagellar basal body L-ring protein FlgH [Candidatus Latescibacterota bacterium]
MSWHTLRALAIWSLGCLLLFPQLSMGQYRSLYSDPKASRIGDALTVIIQENATATNQTATATGKSNSTSIGSAVPGGGNLLDFIPLHSLNSDYSNDYQGQASTSRSARLTARMTVTVTGIKPNGDLIVEGERTLKINGETEAIYLNGSVSQPMVRRDNTVLSSSIADLQVEYTGNGTITQGTRPGLVARLINWVF